MTKRCTRILVFTLLFSALALPLVAGALQDVWIETKEDEKRNVIYSLVNGGERAVYAKVEYEKECSGVANTRKPTVREYFVRPGKPVVLAKTWPQTTCRREFRIVGARYPDQAPR